MHRRNGAGCPNGGLLYAWADLCARGEGSSRGQQEREPIASAEVFASYIEETLGIETTRGYVDTVWATTDQNGHFLLPGHFAFDFRPITITDRYPELRVFHPDYPLGGTSFGADKPLPWDTVVLKLDPPTRKLIWDPKDWSELCSGFQYDACARMCEVAFGSVQACRQLYDNHERLRR